MRLEAWFEKLRLESNFKICMYLFLKKEKKLFGQGFFWYTLNLMINNSIWREKRLGKKETLDLFFYYDAQFNDLLSIDRRAWHAINYVTFLGPIIFEENIR